MNPESDTRTTCYTRHVRAAAKVLGLDEYATADDVLKRLIAGHQATTLADARRIMLDALARYEKHA